MTVTVDRSPPCAWLSGPWGWLGVVLAAACAPATPMPREHAPPSPDSPATSVRALTHPSPPDASLQPDVREDGQATCPEGMVWVHGSYCPDVEQTCLGYLDPPGRYHQYRCREYAPSHCRGDRVTMRFCIDAREHTPPDRSLPAHFVTFRDAARTCTSIGKRVCTEREWNFACEGEAMRPYPYGSRRDAAICHADLTDLKDEDGRLRDRRMPSGSHPGCVSPFGVLDMAGNVEELVASDDDPSVPVMKGAWWLPGRNHCRARQTFHNDRYKGVETGFRCCADAAGPDAGTHDGESSSPGEAGTK